MTMVHVAECIYFNNSRSGNVHIHILRRELNQFNFFINNRGLHIRPLPPVNCQTLAN